MEKIKVALTIEEPAAIRAGLKEFGTVFLEIDPSELTPAQREELLTCKKYENGARNLQKILTHDNYEEWVCEDLAASTAEVVPMVLDARIKFRSIDAAEKKVAEKKVAENLERAIQTLLDKQADQLIYLQNYPHKKYEIKNYEGFGSLPADDPRIIKKRAEVQSFVDEKNQLLQEEKSTAEQAKKAAVIRRKHQLDDWVNNYGTDNQKARHALNLLPENEILDALRNKAFECLDSCERFEHLADDDVCICEYDDGQSHVEYESMQSEEATDYQFDKMSEIMALIPKTTDVYTAQMIDYIGECSMCGNKVVRKSVRIEVVVGELTFSREYAI